MEKEKIRNGICERPEARTEGKGNTVLVLGLLCRQDGSESW